MEDKEKTIKSIVITTLIIVLVICILLWILPKKNKENQNTNNDNKTDEVVVNNIIDSNLRLLQNVGNTYFYGKTLPKEVGDSKKVTLKQLVEEKVLLDLKDANGNTCNVNESYIKLSKSSDNEYILKSYIKCGNEMKQALDTLSCSKFNSCKSDEILPTNDTKKDDETKEEQKNTYTYRYLYSCPKYTTTYSNWSAWTTSYISSSSNIEVQTKVENEQKYVQTGTKQEPVITYVEESYYETVTKDISYINTKPASAKNCVTLPRDGYTRYNCKIETQELKTRKVPKTTYNTVNTYGYESTPVTYYRYRTINNDTTIYNKWSDDNNNRTLLNQGCTIVKSEMVTK